MKVKIKKRILSFVLVVSMVLEMAAAGSVASGTVDVMAAASNKVTTENIYSLAPEYLNNRAYSHYFELCAAQMKEGIDDVSDSQEGFAVFWESIKSGADIITRNVLASFGQGRDYEEEFKYNLVREILFEYIQTDTFVKESVDSIDKTFSNVKTVSKTSKEWNAAAYKAELKKASKSIPDSEIDEMVDTYVEGWESVSEIADVVTKGADVAQFVTTALMMSEIENKALDDLGQIFAKYDMDLVDAIEEIKSEKNNFVEYFRNNYLNDKVRGMIVDSLKCVSGYSTAVLAVKVIDLIMSYTLKPVSASDIVNATLSYGYALKADAAVSGCITEMLRKKSSGEAVSDEDIEKFKTAYNFMIAAYSVGLDKSAKCVRNKTYLKDSIASLKEPLGSSVNFGAYLESCVGNANKAVEDGTLVVSNDTAIKKTPDGTVIDEKYDSTESITAKLAAFKEKYPAGTVWGERFDGAIQCFGFAKLVFYNLFGNYLGTTYQSDKMYQYNPTSTAYLVGQVSGNNVTSASVKNLMASAKVGDIIQGYGMGGYQRGQHTMVFLGLTPDGIEIYDCNAHLNGDTRDCVINQWTMSYDTLALYYGTGSATSGNGLSVYRATNYNEIYGDGTDLFYDDSANFVINDGVLTKYNGWQSYVTIPDTVTAIGDNAFKNNTSMMQVEIPETVTSIGASAFEGCRNLVSVDIPDSVQTIGSSAFYNCTSLASAYLPKNEDYTVVSSSLFSGCTRLKGIVIPDSVTTIECNAFSGCTKLETITIPDRVTTIGSSAFSGCTGLKNVTLSKSLETLSGGVFYNCDGLTEIEIPKNLKNGGESVYEYGKGYVSVGAFAKCSNLKNINFEDGITTIPNYLFARCDGIEKITIPDTVTKIDYRAFDNCINLTEVTIPDSVTTIGDDAFSNCGKLETITIPDSVTTIGSSVFSGCAGLKNVTLSKSLETIGHDAFCNCDGLTEIEIPKSLKNGGESVYEYGKGYVSVGAFAKCSNLKNINFEDGITTIPNYLFARCDGIEKITIPDTVTKIDYRAFDNCINLTEVTIPDSVTTIGDDAFSNCGKLETITIPDSVTTIGSSVFSGCAGLKNVTLSKSLETLSGGVFYNCDGLTEIEIPKSLKNGGESVYEYGKGYVSVGAFAKCSNLKNINFEDGITTISNYLFSRCDGIEKITIPDTVTKIDCCAFENCANLTEVIIPDSITTIEYNAFSNCTKLETITIPDSVTTLGSSVFSGCSALKKVSLSNNIKKLESSTFYNCKKLSELKLPENLKEVYQNAFYNCDALTEIEFPYGTTYIGNNVLQDAGALTKVVIPNTVTSLGSGAFYDCVSLEEVVWGSGIKQINAQTFYGCTVLPKITVPETVTTIGSEVFKNCVKLYDVSIPESVTSIPLDAFSYPKKTTIYGYKDSYAQSYASQKGINFVAVEKKEESSGDNVKVEHDIFTTPDNTSFVAGKLSKNDAQYKAVADTLKEKNITTAYEAYDIKLVDANNQPVQPTGELQMKIALPAGYQAAAAKVYRMEKDGTFTDMKAACEDGNLVFATKYLTTYLVAEDELKEKSDRLFGDANSDGTVNSKDAVLIKKHLAGYTGLGIDVSTADVNADGKVDSKDAVKLLKKLAGYDVVLGKP